MESFGCVHRNTSVTDAAVCCKSDSRKGRYLTAAKKFRAGDIILSNIPYAYVVLNSSIESRCSYCFIKSENLLRCSRCKYLKYCDANCQRKDWKSSHKVECTSLNHVKIASRGNDMFMTDFRLVINSVGMNKGMTEECRYLQKSGVVAEEEVSLCGTTHLSRLSTGSLFNKSHVQEIAHMISTFAKDVLPKDVSRTNIEELLSQFACNNFGIVDELLHCCGAAISPCIALLNHSCHPNCVLRYDFIKGESPIIKVSHIHIFLINLKYYI